MKSFCFLSAEKVLGGYDTRRLLIFTLRLVYLIPDLSAAGAGSL